MHVQLGVIGLGTMGANLARNAARQGADVSIFNRSREKTDAFMKQFDGEGAFVPAENISDFLSSLHSPRAILLMVKAGSAVDEVITEMLPSLNKGDIVIDAGNSHFRDTERRSEFLGKAGVFFVGMGVSGGEEGALKGPSMMPGGDPEAVDRLMPLFQSMAASDGAEGKCVAYVGPGGAGHFVKMVHNGIEYALMQLIAESYDILQSLGKLKNEELASTFLRWSRSEELGSYLLEITARIFAVEDPDTGKDLIDLISDKAGQKGTGKWATESAMKLGVAIPSINASVDARILSGETGLREEGKKFPESLLPSDLSENALIASVASALELSSLSAFRQGFSFVEKMSEDRNWGINLSEVARIWRGGCIIRSRHLDVLCKSFEGEAAEKEFTQRFGGVKQRRWRQVVVSAVSRGIPIPAMSATLSFFDALRRDRLPQNLIQAQRDFFGAHLYRRVDRQGDFHTDWPR